MTLKTQFYNNLLIPCYVLDTLTMLQKQTVSRHSDNAAKADGKDGSSFLHRVYNLMEYTEIFQIMVKI